MKRKIFASSKHVGRNNYVQLHLAVIALMLKLVIFFYFIWKATHRAFSI